MALNNDILTMILHHTNDFYTMCNLYRLNKFMYTSSALSRITFACQKLLNRREYHIRWEGGSQLTLFGGYRFSSYPFIIKPSWVTNLLINGVIDDETMIYKCFDITCQNAIIKYKLIIMKDKKICIGYTNVNILYSRIRYELICI